MLPLIKKIWKVNLIPEDWKLGSIITLPKKVNLTQCSNWRGITFLNTITKIIAPIIQLEIQLRNKQAGCRPGCFCIDSMHTIGIIAEQSTELSLLSYLTFIDFRKSFDGPLQQAIWRTSNDRDVPKGFIIIIQELNRKASSAVIHNRVSNKPFKLTAGGDRYVPSLR